jgi:uncharacterized alpha-E superfamily protein
MLSRVAERIYWAARYLQRVESSARIVNAYTNLLLDLPKEINITWYNLIDLNNAEEEYDARYKIRDERNVVKFTLVDDTNHSSMLTSLEQVRENFRTTRDVVPEDAWEMINELSSFVKDSIANGGLNRAKRNEFLTQVIYQCQMIQGYVASTMSRDSIWHMWRIGRALERADMTTRLLEAGSGILLDEAAHDQIQTPLIVWGNVLRSSSADHAYRRAVSARVRGREVPSFLLFNDEFPRSVNFCLLEIKQSVKTLPKQRKVMEGFKALDELIAMKVPVSKTAEDKLDEKFPAYINKLQIQLANLHQSFSETWFSLD